MYVYIIQSVKYPKHKYTGITMCLKKRINEHNTGKCTHTNKFKPWKFRTIIWFSDESKARKFEKYLKQGSGHAFSKKHF